jgi:YidC/Oxa1 family membrane protein insertase
MLDSLFEFISWLLNFFYELIPNYAVAIALLTCVVMLITTPLTLKGTRSMIEMQRFQPQIRKLQVQYKDDRQKLNEEMMAFYKEHNINPVGSCLPLLIQAPVFSILFYVVRGLTYPYKFTGLQVRLVEMGVIPASAVQQGFRPKYLDHSSALYQALVGQTHMNAFGIDLSRSASTALADGFVEALPYFLLVAVIAGLSWFQQKQIMGRNAGAEVTQQQRTMMIIGPVMYVFFAFVSPAAIGIYFLVSTFWRVVQQYYITRSLYGHEDAAGRQAQRAMAEIREEKKKDGSAAGGKGSGGLLGGLLGNTPADRPTKSGAAAKGGANRATNSRGSGKAAANGRTPARGTSSRNGAGSAKGGAGKNGPQDAPPARTGGGGAAGGTGGPRPHSRSKKKKKRK